MRGLVVGKWEGVQEGCEVVDGDFVGFEDVGDLEGDLEGVFDGCSECGAADGTKEGVLVIGDCDGSDDLDGAALGNNVGDVVGEQIGIGTPTV